MVCDKLEVREESIWNMLWTMTFLNKAAADIIKGYQMSRILL